jgi:hypothetical protein
VRVNFSYTSNAASFFCTIRCILTGSPQTALFAVHVVVVAVGVALIVLVAFNLDIGRTFGGRSGSRSCGLGRGRPRRRDSCGHTHILHGYASSITNLARQDGAGSVLCARLLTVALVQMVVEVVVGAFVVVW